MVPSLLFQKFIKFMDTSERYTGLGRRGINEKNVQQLLQDFALWMFDFVKNKDKIQVFLRAQ